MKFNHLKIGFWALALPFLLLAALGVKAQSPHFRAHSLPQEHRGLSVQTIYQGKDHFIWLGTSNGLFRYDGLQYEYFLQDTTAGNKVSALFQDLEGVLWIGYKSGRIGKIKDNRFVNFFPEEGFPKVPITGFVQASDSSVWFSTYGEGVYFFHGNRLFNLNSDDGLSDDFAYGIATGPKGQLWVGTDAGISVCSYQKGRKKVQVLDTKAGLPDNIVTAVFSGPDGNMLIGTEAAGVCSYDAKTNAFTIITPGWKFGPVTSLTLQPGVIWAGTSRNGLLEINTETKTATQLRHNSKDFNLRISAIASDSDQNIWVASGTSTVFSANRTFTFLSEHQGKPVRNIQSILKTRNGGIWYSTGNGVFNIPIDNNQDEKWRNALSTSRLLNSKVITLYEDVYGAIWFGTFDEGVFIYQPATGKIKQLTEQNGLANNNVLSISGTGNNVWLATLGGVSECILPAAAQAGQSQFRFRNYTSQNGLGSNYIYQVFSDSRKRLWFATDGHGITMLENGRFRNFTFSGGSKNNVIYSITEDSKGNIWASTATAGILRYNGHNFEPYSPKNKLRDLAISAIIGDKKGNILIVSGQGIDVLNTKTGIVYYHGHEFGVSDIDPSLNVYSKDVSGNIWLGVQTGIIKYNGDAASALQWPVTSINKFMVFLDEVDQEDSHILAHDQNHVSFDYIGFWYHDPEEVSYQIKLEGYDLEWSSSKNSFITYPNLAPGDYVFKVKSSATGYFGGAKEAAYAFTIRAPFYNTFWFYGLCLLAAGGILYAVIRYREKQLKETGRQKKEQVEFQFQTLKSQVNPHFLFNSFNTLIAVIEEDQETAVEYVEKLSDFYRNILLHREEDVISLGQELEMIDTYYFLQLKRYKSNFTLKVDVSEPALSLQIPPLTLQLLVENAVKHNIISRDKPLTVSIFTDNDYLVVQNNLQPKQQSEPSTGLGLQNIISRYKLLTSKPVQIEQNESYFIARLPLIAPQE